MEYGECAVIPLIKYIMLKYRKLFTKLLYILGRTNTNKYTPVCFKCICK